MYQTLYAGVELDGLRASATLPLLTAARLRATPLIEQIDRPEDAFRTFTPWALSSRVTPAAIALDRDDTNAWYDLWHTAARLLGWGRGQYLVIVTPPYQRYVAAEMADVLGYFRIAADVLVDQDCTSTLETLRSLAPETVVDLSTTSSGPKLPDGVRRITVRRPQSEGADLFITPEAGLVAVRPPDAVDYVILSEWFELEEEEGIRHFQAQEPAPRSSPLVLTALRRYHQPLVRYLLGDRGAVRRGRLGHLETVP